MQCADGVLQLLERNQRGDADFGRGDHQHVHALVAQRVEELGSQAGVGLHTHAHHGHLAHVGVDVEGLVAQFILLLLQHIPHLGRGGTGHGEGNVGGAGGSGGLHDHVDVHAGLSQHREHLGGHARLVRHTAHGGQRFGVVVRDAGNDRDFRPQIGEQVTQGLVVVFAHVLTFVCKVLAYFAFSRDCLQYLAMPCDSFLANLRYSAMCVDRHLPARSECHGGGRRSCAHATAC